MKGRQHQIFSIFMYILATIAFGSIFFAPDTYVIGMLIGTFCGAIGWFQWQMGESGTGPKAVKDKKWQKPFRRIFGVVLLTAAAILLVIGFVEIEDRGVGYIAIAAFIYGFGWVEFKSASDKGYNQLTDGLRRIETLEVPMDKIYEDFKDVETPLGKPWLTHVSTITDRDCIVWGPVKNGSFVFAYYLSGTLNLSNSDDMSWFRDKKAAYAHKRNDLNTVHPAVRSAVLEDVMIKLCVSMYEQMLRNYAKTGQANWIYPKLTNFFDAKVYVFDESFYWTKSVYHLIDIDGRNVYDIEGALPLINFKITNSYSREELFTIKKNLTKVALEQYEFFYRGEDIGTLKQEFQLGRDCFVLDCPMGRVELKSVNATFGKNWYVTVNDMLVGTFAAKLGLGIRDVIFDNYVIMCYDDQYLPLLAGLAIMAERETVRDGEQFGISN